MNRTLATAWTRLFSGNTYEKLIAIKQLTIDCVGRGDSLSKHTDKACSTIRLDLRIVIQNDGGDIESMAGEFASATAATGSKYYTDKTKIVLISKVHLNQVLSALNIPSKEDVVSIRIPMIQIMGMNCNIYSLSLVDKRTYRVEDVCDFIYPTTLRQIKNGTLATMINSMEMLKVRFSIKGKIRTEANSFFALQIAHDRRVTCPYIKLQLRYQQQSYQVYKGQKTRQKRQH